MPKNSLVIGTDPDPPCRLCACGVLRQKLHRLFFGMAILWALVAGGGSFSVCELRAADGNQLDYLQQPLNPYYVGRNFPKLVTPQWVGETGVDAVVVLAIDDMRDPLKYEGYLRPILDRLKQIDGRASLSIMTNTVDPADAQLQTWLAEGLSIEAHTMDHPCPCLSQGDFPRSRSTYDRCVDLLHQIPGNDPVAFRMPCCDSLNTTSPRFWTEIFNRQTPGGHFLSIDSSVFNITTDRDRDLPRELTMDHQGRPRFRKYLPFPSFVNTIEDYPYPYIIGDVCWEFPCVVPSDWEAQHLHQPNNPQTVTDMKAALDATVIKQGTFNLVFHPHGWIRAEQIVELIDHAQATYGARVKFLTFREALERLNSHLLNGHPLRNEDGTRNRVTLADLDNDGFQDVVVHSETQLLTRLWSPATRQWHEVAQAAADVWPATAATRWARHASDLYAQAWVAATSGLEQWKLSDSGWQRTGRLPGDLDDSSNGLEERWRQRLAQPQRLDGLLVKDLDRDGRMELLLEKEGETLILETSSSKRDAGPAVLPWHLPAGVSLPNLAGQDSGLRFVDIDEDGFDDLLFSNGQRYVVALFESLDSGFSREVLRGERHSVDGSTLALPMIVRPDGSNNGAWFHSQHLWVQNEHTDRLPDLVDRVSWAEILGGHLRPADPRWGGWPGPRLPEQSRAAIHTPRGLRAELVAAEPLIADPVAFDWGFDGRLWVVEMHDYPNGLDGQGKPGGRVKVLTDVNGDGRFDQATTFLDEIPFPTGIKVWREGVIVSGAPEIIWAKDANGDDVADSREVLFRGFAESNQQHRVNGLRWGVDGWLYLANGEGGGSVESVRTGERVRTNGRDLRIRPDTGEIQAIEGQSQFGRNCDDFGNWFSGNNSEPLWHYVLEDRYASRNPNFAPGDLTKNVPVVSGPAPVFPRSRTVERFNDFDRADRFTSACSHMIYRDHLLEIRDQEFAFICEPVHNLVHREAITRDGLTFTSQRLPSEERSEVLASEDNWFRPVMAQTGPDGALWVADMYRLVIEHPEWIPDAWQARLDVRAGDDRGRIYRLRSVADDGLRPVPHYQELSLVELTMLLDTPNGTVRDMAQQQLWWQIDPQDSAEVADFVAAAGQIQTPAGLLAAQYTLASLARENPRGPAAEALPDWLLRQVRQGPAEVARHALRVAENQPARSQEMAEAAMARAAESLRESPATSGSATPALRAQIVMFLASSADQRAVDAVADIAQADGADHFFRTALLSSITGQNIVPLLSATAGNVSGSSAEWQLDLVGEMALQAAKFKQDPEAIRGAADVALQLIAVNPVRGHRVLAQLLDDVQGNELLASALGPQRNERISRAVQQARQTAFDTGADDALRVAAVQLLGIPGRAAGIQAPTDAEDDSAADSLPRLLQLLGPQSSFELQAAVLNRLQRLNAPGTAGALLQRIGTYSPRLQSRVVELSLSRNDWTNDLIESLQEGLITRQMLDARQRQKLMQQLTDEQRSALPMLNSATGGALASELRSKFAECDATRGDRERGQRVFQRVCATCHQLQGIGHSVGPSLANLSNRSADALLTAILDPNRAVEAAYLSYAMATTQGLRHSGIIANESSAAVTLLAPDAVRQTVLRNEIEEFVATGKSLMPEGLGSDLTPQEMSDLLAFLGTTTEQPKFFPGNEPQLAPTRNDGSIRLFAVHAQIYGPTLVFEAKNNNLGYWQSVEDRAVWRVHPHQAGRFDVRLDYACADDTAGNSYALIAGDQVLTGITQGTGSWDQFRGQSLGVVELPEGESTIMFRAAGPIAGFLFDLRTVYLYPAD